MPEDLSSGKCRGEQSPLRQTYERIAPQARKLGHQLENDEKMAGNLLEQLEDVQAGDPWAYLTSKSRAMYFTAKDECRQLFAFKAEKFPVFNENNSDPLDTELLKFEKKHEALLGEDDKAQYAQNAVVLMEERDKLMTVITRKLLDQLGVDMINFENLDTSVSSNIGNFIGLCNCFNSLSKVMKSMSKDESEYINQIVGLRRQQELFQEDLQTRNAEYDRLQNQYHSLRNTIKQVSILRQQHVIETLEAKASKQLIEIEALNIARRGLAESESYLKDRLRLATVELAELRRVHEQSIVELRPVLEGHIRKSQSDRAELQRLRAEVEASATRLALIENKTKQAETASEAKEQERLHVLSLLKSERDLSNRLRGDLASQKRILTSAAAANINHKKGIQELNEIIQQKNSVISLKDSEIENHNQENIALKQKIVGLEKLAMSAVSERDAALREHRATESLLAMQKVELRGVQHDLDEFLKDGFTPEKKTEFEKMGRTLVVTKDELGRIREQNKLYERRLRDLEIKIAQAAKINAALQEKSGAPTEEYCV